MRRGFLAALLVVTLLLVPSRGASARALSWEGIPVGYEVTPDELRDTLDAGAIEPGRANDSAGALRLAPMEATLTRRDDPAYLLLSNAPEILNPLSLPTKRGLLVTARIPAGTCRIMASHANLHAGAADVVLRMRNESETPAEVVLQPRFEAQQSAIPATFRRDAGVGAWLAQGYLQQDRALRASPPPWRPPDGEVKRILARGEVSDAVLLSGFRGLASCLATLTTTAPLTLSVYATPAGYRPAEDAPVLTRTGSQARGLFEKPDCDVEATADIAEGRPSRYVFGQAERDNALGVLDGGAWMRGADTTVAGREDSQVNRGDFGGFTHLTLTVQSRPDSPYRSALLLLVAGGRKAAVLLPPKAPDTETATRVLPQWGAVAVARVAAGQTWRYEYTLPPNSWAPVYLVAVPLRGN